ncbi:choice-of-anchor D domain-containing protein [Actinoallomurus purpureus]|uniref:choice-of-anchor D domain-containing protein n=1 Tax=Actinoallomurus purpureus TaxID=478114 RepID=UPI00209384B4|nr:choice-of-anchor D domain-containing protein [Actinoallomurus purpureus]
MGFGMRLATRSRVGRALLAVLAGTAVAVATGTAVPAAGDVTTVSRDPLRTGWDRDEPGLGPAAVGSSDFGQLFATQLDGQVYAQPLSVDGTLIATTEHNNVYGLDPATGAITWQRALGPSWPASAITCGDLAPDLGSTSAPVYDPASKAVYLTTKVNDGADVQHPHWYMHALDPATGDERPGWPVTIAGTATNDPTVAFDPMVEMQRPGLLLLDGAVYAGFGAHCDHGEYRGYVVGVSTTAAKVTSMWASEVTSSSKGAGIWQSGGGLVSDGSGRVFLSTGNGVMAPAGPGNKPPGTLSESVVRLDVGADGTLSAGDFFSPANAPKLDTNDTDLGAGGPIALPDSFGTSAHPHVLVEQGKDGRVFLLDRDALGGRSQGAGGTDAVLGVVGPYQGQWGHPAAWSGGDGGYVYLIGNGGPLRALRAGASDSLPALTQVGASAEIFPYTSGSPVITSDGGKAESAVVWAVWADGPKGGNAQLRAYSALPDGQGRLRLLWSTPIGTAVKFTVPATDGGRVFVGTRDGKVIGFGRPAASVLTGSPVDFGGTDVGGAGTRTLTLTATRDLTITALSTSAPFGVTAPALPLSLAKDATVDLPVSFTPAGPGAAGDILWATTDAGTVGFALNGLGTKAGLTSTPAAATFNEQPVGSTATVNVQVTNTGTADETITSVTGATGPFTVSGLPAADTVVKPGGSFVVAVTYAPAAPGSDGTSVTVTSTSGTLTVPVTGTAVTGAGRLVITPGAVDFGSLATGSSRSLSFDITNAGNLPVTVPKAKAPIGDFTSIAPLAEGTVISPGDVVHQSVTFTPTRPGAQTATYDLTGDAGQGLMSVKLTGTGTGTLPAPDAVTWSVNGAAKVTGTDLLLNPAATRKAGSAFYRRAVPTEGLHARFTAELGPGTGGDGLAFALLDPRTQTPASVGRTGAGVGFLGLRGVAVTLVTTKNTQAKSANFTGVAAGPGGTTLTYRATAKVSRSLRSGTHAVDVTVTGGRLKVAVDGRRLLDVAAPAGSLPATALPGFTAGTGTRADAHTVRGVTITTVAAKGAPLTASPASLDFGEVQVGGTGTAKVTLTNHGGQPETVSAVAAPDVPYTVSLPSAGTTVAPGASVSVPVTFRPAIGGTVTGSLGVTTTSGRTVVPLTGTGDDELPDLTTSTWGYSGFTSVAGSTVTLTRDGQKSGAGTLINAIAVRPRGLHVTFTAQIGGAHDTGADGLTVALLDASAATSASIGAAGAGLGVAGLPAVFAALDTYGSGGVKSHNFAGVGTASAGSGTLTFLKTTTAIPPLRTGTHAVDVRVTTASHMVVRIDGTQVLDVAVTLPPKVLVGFTGAVGGVTDTHAVLDPHVTYTGQ